MATLGGGSQGWNTTNTPYVALWIKVLLSCIGPLMTSKMLYIGLGVLLYWSMVYSTMLTSDIALPWDSHGNDVYLPYRNLSKLGKMCIINTLSLYEYNSLSPFSSINKAWRIENLQRPTRSSMPAIEKIIWL